MVDDLPLPEALRRLRMAMPRTPVEELHPLAAVGRVLARGARTPHPSPPVDVSAMDGYAVRAQDTPGVLRCVGTALPGLAPPALTAGTCVTVLTGAAIPPQADAVVALEDAAETGGVVTLPAARRGRHVVAAGAACPPTSIPAGTKVTLAVAACLAAGGVERVKVHRALPVRVIPLGSELAEGTVLDLLSPLLSHQLEALGCDVARVPPVPDEEEAVLAALEGREPLIVTTGGTGPSDRDLVARLGQGRLLIESVNVKPGRPTKAIRLGDGRLWVALPGNPVSALLMATGLLVPALREAFEGAAVRRLVCLAAEAIPGHPTRWRLAPVAASPAGLRACKAGPSVAPGWLRDAVGVVAVPPGAQVPAGSSVEVMPW